MYCPVLIESDKIQIKYVLAHRNSCGVVDTGGNDLLMCSKRPKSTVEYLQSNSESKRGQWSGKGIISCDAVYILKKFGLQRETK